MDEKTEHRENRDIDFDALRSGTTSSKFQCMSLIMFGIGGTIGLIWGLVTIQQRESEKKVWEIECK